MADQQEDEARAAGDALEAALMRATQAVERELARIVKTGEDNLDRLARKIAETLAQLAIDGVIGSTLEDRAYTITAQWRGGPGLLLICAYRGMAGTSFCHGSGGRGQAATGGAPESPHWKGRKPTSYVLLQENQCGSGKPRQHRRSIMPRIRRQIFPKGA